MHVAQGLEVAAPEARLARGRETLLQEAPSETQAAGRRQGVHLAQLADVVMLRALQGRDAAAGEQLALAFGDEVGTAFARVGPVHRVHFGVADRGAAPDGAELRQDAADDVAEGGVVPRLDGAHDDARQGLGAVQRLLVEVHAAEHGRTLLRAQEVQRLADLDVGDGVDLPDALAARRAQPQRLLAPWHRRRLEQPVPQQGAQGAARRGLVDLEQLRELAVGEALVGRELDQRVALGRRAVDAVELVPHQAQDPDQTPGGAAELADLLLLGGRASHGLHYATQVV